MSKRKLQEGVQTRAKKQKLEAEMGWPAQNVELSDFENLPDHIIEKIVNKLGKSDILSMFLVSKHINWIISNNARNLRPFELIFPPIADLRSGRYSNFLGVRKYSSMIFNYCIKGKDMPIAINFLKSYAENLKCIKIDTGFVFGRNLGLTKHMLVEILTVCCNIKNLSVIGFPYWRIEDRTVENRWTRVLPLRLPHLQSLTFPRIGWRLIDLFKTCELKSFELALDPSEHSSEFIKSFLQTQSGLKHLELNYSRSLFEDDALSNVNFKLNSLHLNSIVDFEMNDNFAAFISKQENSVTALRLLNFRPDLADFLFNIPMHSVFELALNKFSNYESSLYNVFPNLKVILLIGCTIQADFLQHLPHVERVSLVSCIIDQKFSISKLKLLHLARCTSNFEGCFEMHDNQLQILHIEEGRHNWIEEMLDHDDTKLSILAFNGSIYNLTENTQLHAALVRNEHKVQFLYMKP